MVAMVALSLLFAAGRQIALPYIEDSPEASHSSQKRRPQRLNQTDGCLSLSKIKEAAADGVAGCVGVRIPSVMLLISWPTAEHKAVTKYPFGFFGFLPIASAYSKRNESRRLRNR